MSAQPRLRIGLLGQFRLSLDDQVLPILAQRRKASDIIKLLALQPKQRLHREQVVDALWPDLDQKAGMNNLHQNLYHARRMLEPGLSRGARPRFLTFEHETLVLYASGPLEVDYFAFLRGVSQARRQGDAALYEAAVALYQGDLLPEDMYEDWTEPQRDEARSLYLAALHELARLLEQQDELLRAGRYLEQAIAKEPTAEAAHLALMQIYARTGRRMEAIRQFQTLRQALVHELGEEPDESTRAVYEQILQQLPNLKELAESAEPRPARPGWVPAALSPLVGRERELEETLQLLSSTRCLTLTGAAGSGKTRLAQELASRLQGQYEGGVWWVELVALSNAQMILPAIAQTLGVHGTSEPLKSVLERLQGSKALLVLDNCEHLIEGCAQTAIQLLKSLPGLQLLATSRESLGIEGEIAWVVAPLQVPAPEADGYPEALERCESVRFLLGRIRQRQPHFQLDGHNADYLAQICRRLEGLPLALELVATWVGTLSLEQIVARLDNSLRLLTRGHRGVERHHQTLEAALEWSYALLGEPEKNLFVRLSVFVGGWRLEAAEMLCADQGMGAGELAEWHARLVRTSMVMRFEEGSQPRFRMLEPVRQFAQARLEALGLAEATQQRLLECYLAEATRIAPKLTGAEQAHWYSHLSREYENIRAVLHWSQSCQLDLGLQLAARLWRFWQVKGHAQEILVWFEEALPQARQVPPAVLAEAYNAAGIMARTCGLYDRSFEYLTQALALRRALADRRGEAIALNNLAVSARDQADYPKVEHYGRQSLAIAREIGDRNLEALGLMNLGVALRGQAQDEAAREHFQQSLAIFSELGEKRSVAALYNYLGGLAQDQGHWQKAQLFYQQGLELNQELGDFWGLGISTHNLAALRYEQQEYAEAWEALQQSLTYYRRAGVRHGLNECFETFARLAHKRGELEQAAWALGVLEYLEDDMGVVVSSQRRDLRERLAEELRLAMGQAAYMQARQRGRRNTLEDAYQHILGRTPQI